MSDCGHVCRICDKEEYERRKRSVAIAAAHVKASSLDETLLAFLKKNRNNWTELGAYAHILQKHGTKYSKDEIYSAINRFIAGGWKRREDVIHI